jgi:hypothetical protein
MPGRSHIASYALSATAVRGGRARLSKTLFDPSSGVRLGE